MLFFIILDRLIFRNTNIILSRRSTTEDDYFASRGLDVFITKLRKLFADDPQIEIVTKRGTGYILVIKE